MWLSSSSSTRSIRVSVRVWAEITLPLTQLNEMIVVSELVDMCHNSSKHMTAGLYLGCLWVLSSLSVIRNAQHSPIRVFANLWRYGSRNCQGNEIKFEWLRTGHPRITRENLPQRPSNNETHQTLLSKINIYSKKNAYKLYVSPKNLTSILS